MASFNKVIIMGNLTRDPEMRYTPKGMAVAKVGMALNRQWRTEAGEQKEEVTFVDVTVWGRTAENVGQYMRKGSLMMVEGRLNLEQWDDKQTGQKRQRLTVVGETVQFMPSGQRTEGGAPAAARPAAKGTGITSTDHIRGCPALTGGSCTCGGEAPPPDPEDDVPF